MTLTITEIQRYRDANSRFGRVVSPILGAIPHSLAMAHICRVNPALLGNPAPTKDQRKGFMRVTHEATIDAGITWDAVEAQDTNAYVWSCELNSDGKLFAHTNPSLFATPNADYWMCVYTRHALGPVVFNVLWNSRNLTLKEGYPALVAAAQANSSNLLTWTPTDLRRLLVQTLPKTFELATRNGILYTSKFGIRPVLSAGRTQQILLKE